MVTIPVNILGDISNHADGPFNNLSSQKLDLFTWNDVFNESTSATYSHSSTLDLNTTFNISKFGFENAMDNHSWPFNIFTPIL